MRIKYPGPARCRKDDQKERVGAYFFVLYKKMADLLSYMSIGLFVKIMNRNLSKTPDPAPELPPELFEKLL